MNKDKIEQIGKKVLGDARNLTSTDRKLIEATAEAQLKELQETTYEEMLKNVTLELSNWSHYLTLDANGELPGDSPIVTPSDREAGFILHEFILPMFNAKLKALKAEIERLKKLNEEIYEDDQIAIKQAVKEAVEKERAEISKYLYEKSPSNLTPFDEFSIYLMQKGA